MLSELRGRGVEAYAGELDDADFDTWNLAPGGLLVSFAPDEVAPGAIGEITVLVEHAKLQDLYREGTPAR